MAQSRIHVLIDSAVTIRANGDMFCLFGFDNAMGGDSDLDRVSARCPPEVPVVAFLHQPDLADVVAKIGRVSLQLSGHSHGGQVRLPFLGALVLPPDAQKYDHGLYRVGGMWLYTNRGIGVVGSPWGPPVRFNCRPEVTEITLVATR